MAEMYSGNEGDEGGVVGRTKQIRRYVPFQQIPGSSEALRGIPSDCFGASGTVDLAIRNGCPAFLPAARRQSERSEEALGPSPDRARSHPRLDRLQICSVLGHGCAGR